MGGKKFDPSLRPIQRVLFIRTDRMGDALMNLPALRVLRQTFPKAWLTVLLDESVAELFRDHPDIDEVLVFPKAAVQKNARLKIQWILRIRKIRFDMAIVSNPDKFMHFLTFAAGVPCRIGYGRKWGCLLTKSLPDTKSERNCHEIDFNLELVRLVSDQSWDGRIELPQDAAATEEIGRRLAVQGLVGRSVVAVHAGTSAAAKRWPEENFTALCREIKNLPGVSPILIGGPEEKDFSQRIAERAGVAADWTGKLSLRQLTAFLTHPQIKAIVSSDSGPVHVAWMGGTPAVAMYAKNTVSSNPVRWGPKDGRSQVIYKNMNEITTQEVLEALKKVLGL